MYALTAGFATLFQVMYGTAILELEDAHLTFVSAAYAYVVIFAHHKYFSQ